MAGTRTKIINQQLTLAIQLNDESTLSDFCWSPNPLLKKHLIQMLEKDEEHILYIWGKRGSGKSHLLQACCNISESKHNGHYLPLSLLKEWSPECINDIEKQASIICIDDVDAIAGMQEWEHEIFHLFNRIKDNEKSILILSSQSPPQFSPIQLPDLKSRLSWGLIIQIHELNDEDKLNRLQFYAQRQGFTISKPVGQFLINRSSRNMSDLIRLINDLDKASLAEKRKITIPFVKSYLNL